MTITVKKTVEVQVPLIGDGDKNGSVDIERTGEGSALTISTAGAVGHELHDQLTVCARDLVEALKELYPEGGRYLPGSETARIHKSILDGICEAMEITEFDHVAMERIRAAFGWDSKETESRPHVPFDRYHLAGFSIYARNDMGLLQEARRWGLACNRCNANLGGDRGTDDPVAVMEAHAHEGCEEKV